MWHCSSFAKFAKNGHYSKPMRTLLISIAGALLFALPARAACNGISSVGLAFGSYDVFQALPTDTAGSLSYTCSPGPTVTFSASLNGAMGPRQMIHFPLGVTDVLKYDVYFDSARTIVWGLSPIALPSGSQTIPFYGRIFPGQDIVTGTYFDVITITLNF